MTDKTQMVPAASSASGDGNARHTIVLPDGRTALILPRNGQLLFWIGGAECEDCPRLAQCEKADTWPAESSCPDVVRSEPWAESDMDQLEALLSGKYWLTRETAEKALNRRA